MYDTSITVEIPEKAIVSKNAKASYVYYCLEKRYFKNKQYNSDKRITIGKVDDSNEKMMFPNENFKMLFPDEYAAKKPDENSSEKTSFSQSITYGQTALLHQLFKETRLKNILLNKLGSDSFDNETTTNNIFNLACCFLLTQNSSVINFPYFARNNLILGRTIYNDSTIGNILSSISRKQCNDIMVDWLKEHTKNSGVFLSVDGSNTPSESEDLELVDVGHGKSGLEENQFAYTLITEQNFQRPLFLEEYKGSIHDLNALGPILKLLNELNVKNIKFLLDRGYFSAKLMKSLLNKGHDFVLMAKDCKKTKEIIDQYYNEIKGCDKYIPEHDLNGLTIVRNLFEHYDKKVCFHVFFNEERYNIEKKIVKQNIATNMEKLKLLVGKKISVSEAESLSRFHNLIIDDDGVLINFEYENNKVENLLKYKGFFTIITSYSATAEKAYTDYHTRDYTEKMIMMMKTNEQFDVCRVHDEEHLTAKTLAMFVGLILRNELYLKTKELRSKTKDKKLYTTSNCLRELGCIKAIQHDEIGYYNDRPLSKVQTNIINACGVSKTQLNAELSKFNSCLLV